MKVSAVITAAGLSSRMKDFKPLLPLKGSTIIGTLIGAFKTAGVQDIIVVTGRDHELLEGYLKEFEVRTVHNPRYAETDMFTSIVLGLQALEQDTDCVFITPCDIPLISSETIQALLRERQDISKPVYHGKSGHPLLISQKVIPEILSYRGNDGLRGAVSFSGSHVQKVQVDDPGILFDADTPEDYQFILSKLKQS